MLPARFIAHVTSNIEGRQSTIHASLLSGRPMRNRYINTHIFAKCYSIMNLYIHTIMQRVLTSRLGPVLDRHQISVHQVLQGEPVCYSEQT